MASLSLELGTPQATQVQDAIQRVLVQHDMASADDSVMAEYVTVMIANRKGPEMIAEELRELMGSELDTHVVEQLWNGACAAAEGEAAPSAAPPAARDRSASPPPRDTAPRAHDRWDEPRARAPARRERENKRRNGRTPKEPAKPASISLLGRAGIPDPRAAPFVPSEAVPPPFMAMAAMAAMAGGGAPSLFSRLDPMMPDNGPPVAAPAAPRDPAAFPTQPTDEALCRWSLACTNPLCTYSHPSPANAGKNGDAQALVLRADACEKGGACDDKECVLSHVSPAVAFISARGSAPSTAPCRFQQQCLNPACTYAHYGANGEPVPPPGKMSSTPCRFGLGCTRAGCAYMHPTQRSATACRYGDECTRPERLQGFAHEDPERERILPGGAA